MHGHITLMTKKITRDEYGHEYRQVDIMVKKNNESKRNYWTDVVTAARR